MSQLNGNAVKEIQIPTPTIRTVEAKIVGQSPYLCEALTIQAVKDMYADKPTKKSRGEPQDQADERTYWTKDGIPAATATALKNCMVSSARHFEHDRSINMTRVRGLFFVHGDDDGLVPLFGDISLHEAWVREGQAPQVRYRNMVMPWEATLKINYAADQISLEVLMQLLVNGGMLYGVGGWRPGKGGNYGTFSVEDAVG